MFGVRNACVAAIMLARTYAHKLVTPGDVRGNVGKEFVNVSLKAQIIACSLFCTIKDMVGSKIYVLPRNMTLSSKKDQTSQHPLTGRLCP
jgi:hypothetical protein